MTHTIELDDEPNAVRFTSLCGPKGQQLAQVTLSVDGDWAQIPAEHLDQLCGRWLAHRAIKAPVIRLVQQDHRLQALSVNVVSGAVGAPIGIEVSPGARWLSSELLWTPPTPAATT